LGRRLRLTRIEASARRSFNNSFGVPSSAAIAMIDIALMAADIGIRAEFEHPPKGGSYAIASHPASLSVCGFRLQVKDPSDGLLSSG
jgi:hypothetical protein